MAIEKKISVKVTGTSNDRLVSACLQAVATCGDRNACFSPRGITIKEACVGELARQITRDACLTNAFGLATTKAAASGA